MSKLCKHENNMKMCKVCKICKTFKNKLKKNIPNKIKHIKLTEPNLQNQTYEIRSHVFSRGCMIFFILLRSGSLVPWQCFFS